MGDVGSSDEWEEVRACGVEESQGGVVINDEWLCTMWGCGHPRVHTHTHTSLPLPEILTSLAGYCSNQIGTVSNMH